MTNTLDLIITESHERVLNLKPSSILVGNEHGHLSIEWIYRTREKTKGFGDKFMKSRLNYKKRDYESMKSYFRCKMEGGKDMEGGKNMPNF